MEKYKQSMKQSWFYEITNMTDKSLLNHLGIKQGN